MFKLMITMRRKAGTSFEEFVTYYNDRHLPYVASLMPAQTGTRRVHFRNFVQLDDPFLDHIEPRRAVKSDPAFDAVTEVLFEDRESAIAYFEMFHTPERFALIEADERNFVDLDSIKFHVVECIRTERTV